MLRDPAQRPALLHQVSTVACAVEAASFVPPAVLDWAALCDVLEFRVDVCPEAGDDVLTALREAVPAATLITVRRPDEGGQNNLDDTRRARLYERYLPVADMVDIELRSLPDFSWLVRDARAAGVLTVASVHDFTATPDEATLHGLIRSARQHGVDALKIAATLHSHDDLFRLLRLLDLPDRPPLSLMGMGPLGKMSRLLLGHHGSILNYGYLDRPTVPGQWPAARLKAVLAELKSS